MPREQVVASPDVPLPVSTTTRQMGLRRPREARTGSVRKGLDQGALLWPPPGPENPARGWGRRCGADTATHKSTHCVSPSPQLVQARLRAEPAHRLVIKKTLPPAWR